MCLKTMMGVCPSHRPVKPTCSTVPSQSFTSDEDCCWRELPQVSFLSRQILLCLSQQKLCRDKIMFVATSVFLSRRNTSFVATKLCLSRQTLYLWQPPPMIEDSWDTWQQANNGVSYNGFLGGYTSSGEVDPKLYWDRQ